MVPIAFFSRPELELSFCDFPAAIFALKVFVLPFYVVSVLISAAFMLCFAILFLRCLSCRVMSLFLNFTGAALPFPLCFVGHLLELPNAMRGFFCPCNLSSIS